MDRGELLLSLMHRAHVGATELADALNMDRSTFYRKVKNPQASFTMEQVIKVKNVLSLSKENFQAIFF